MESDKYWHIATNDVEAKSLCGKVWVGLFGFNLLKHPKAIAHLDICPECLERIKITVVDAPPSSPTAKRSQGSEGEDYTCKDCGRDGAKVDDIKTNYDALNTGWRQQGIDHWYCEACWPDHIEVSPNSENPDRKGGVVAPKSGGEAKAGAYEKEDCNGSKL